MTVGNLAPAVAPGRFQGGCLADAHASVRILDAGTGNRGLTQAMLGDRGWPGAGLALPDGADAWRGAIILAQATTMPMPGAMGGTPSPGSLPAVRFPSIDGVEVGRLGSGALRVGGVVLAAGALSREIDDARQRAAVDAGIGRFGLDGGPGRRRARRPSLRVDEVDGPALVWQAAV